MEPKLWIPRNVITAYESTEPYVIVVLNRGILLKPSEFAKLWNNASVRALTDGGANEWLRFITKNNIKNDVKAPDFLIGDMDSVTNSSKQQVIALGCQVIETPDQSETDFTKTLLTLQPILLKQNIRTVITILNLSGRIDHFLSQINTLFKARKFLADVDVYLMTKDSLSWLLNSGDHKILIPETFVKNQIWCSYVPIDGKCCVSTTGFKWDVSNRITQFGGMLSTSNTYASQQLTMKCDEVLLWSMGTECEPIHEDN